MVLNPGTSGDLFQIATSGIGQADGIFSYDNQEPVSIFYGTAANGWGPTSTTVGEFTAIKAETYASAANCTSAVSPAALRFAWSRSRPERPRWW